MALRSRGSFDYSFVLVALDHSHADFNSLAARIRAQLFLHHLHARTGARSDAIDRSVFLVRLKRRFFFCGTVT